MNDKGLKRKQVTAESSKNREYPPKGTEVRSKGTLGSQLFVTNLISGTEWLSGTFCLLRKKMNKAMK